MLRHLLNFVSLLVGISTGQAYAAGDLIAPGYGTLDYAVPVAGSYPLPPLGPAADALVLDSNGKERQLYQLFGERYALLSFMYSSCSDVNGCPLTAHVFYRLQRAMAENPTLAKSLKLVSLSFDPEHDTPQAMRLYANNFLHTGAPDQWRFATTHNQQQLAPILDAY
ncbi:MAG: SCO family protein, partial [Gammaproteobacteria bacterium]|nr:SCO family protein [Gammaproteobacteria bacterium]